MKESLKKLSDSLFQPVWLLLIAAAFAFFFPAMNKFDTTSSIGLPILILAVSMFLALYGLIRFRPSLKPKILLMALSLTFALWVTFSFFLSQTQNVGYGEVIMVWSGVLLLMAPPAWWKAKILTIGGIVALSLSSLLGLFLYLNSIHQRLFGLFFDPATHTDAWPNAFALFVIMLWPLLLLWRPQRRWLHWFRSSLFVVNFAAILLTFSRAGISVFLLQVVVLAIWWGWKKGPRPFFKNLSWYGKKILFLTLIFSLSAAISAAVLLLRHRLFHQPTPLLADKVTFANGEDITSVQERFHFWQGSLRLIAEKPIFGFGPMSFGYVYRGIQQAWLEISDHPHNFFLKIAVENGLPAMLLMLSIILTLLFRTFKSWSRYDAESKFQLMIFWIALAGGLIHNQVDYNLNFLTNALVWWLLLKAIDIKSTLVNDQAPAKKKAMYQNILCLVGIFGAISFASLSLYPFLVRLVTRQEFPLEQKVFIGRFALLEAGDWFSNDGQLEKAQWYYQRELKKNPFDAAAYSRLGDLYRSQKNFKEAISFFQKAIEVDPRNEWLYYRNLVETLDESQQTDQLLRFAPQLIAQIKSYLPKVEANLHYDAQQRNPQDLLALLKIMDRNDIVLHDEYWEFEKAVRQSIEKYASTSHIQ